jgi:predicted nucleic acid-binding protein
LILDTNGLSAVVDGNPGVEPLLRKASRVTIPVIVLGEYRYGISQSRHRKRYEHWLLEYLRSFELLDIDAATTIPYAAIRQELKKAGTPIPANDVWIAALSRQHQLPFLSRDLHFDLVAGLDRLDW